MTEHQIQLQLQEHVNIHHRLQQECEFWLSKNKEQVNANSSLAAFSRGIYYCFLIYRLDLENFIQHEINNEQPDEIFNIYKGRKSIRIFLDIINMFEAQVNHITTNCISLKEKLTEKIKPQIESVEKNWKEDEVKVKDGIQKKDVLRQIESKVFESSFRRRAIYNLNWIEHDEFMFLEFCWFLRNCMHNDFSALADKHFVYNDEETNEKFEINLEKGKIIHLHARLIYSLSRKIARILDKIIESAYS
jgi:hypothetical protein